MYVLLCPFCSLGEASPVQLLKCTSLPVECCKEAGNVSIAPPGQSPPVPHNGRMGWSRKGRGLGKSLELTPEAAPATTPQLCCSCRHPVNISHLRTSLCPPTAGFHTAPCWAPSPGKERVSLRGWSTSVGVVWIPVKEGQQDCHSNLATKLPVPPVQGPSMRWSCPPQERSLELQKSELTALSKPYMESPGQWAAERWMGAHLRPLSVLRALAGSQVTPLGPSVGGAWERGQAALLQRQESPFPPKLCWGVPDLLIWLWGALLKSISQLLDRVLEPLRRGLAWASINQILFR